MFEKHWPLFFKFAKARYVPESRQLITGPNLTIWGPGTLLKGTLAVPRTPSNFGLQPELEPSPLQRESSHPP